MELFEGRPENTEGRLPREIRTYDLLDELGIAYQRTDHEPADNMEACNAIDAVLGVIICKNLFLCNRQKTRFYLLMMPGDKKFKTKELSAQINSSRLSFADAEDMLKYLDIEPGAEFRHTSGRKAPGSMCLFSWEGIVFRLWILLSQQRRRKRLWKS